MDIDTQPTKPATFEADQKMTEYGAYFNKNIRPLLDAVDKLRNLKVTNEGIPLPSIVVVGDQSSGKSSVLESLATISLPRGHGIATRVPLVLRLQSCRPEEGSSIVITYKEQSLKIAEDEIKSAVDKATIALAGDGKGVTDTPISLHIRKPNAPDLTMIDLPGITRVPVHGQPQDIYEQIAAMIKLYLKPRETVILNVLSATTDFSTCESIRMSQLEDTRGERTLAVVTKVDRAPEDVYEKVTADEVNIGLGYICVRNRTDNDASHEEARKEERRLFEKHPSLSRLDKATVGISALAERLTEIQANIIRQSLPGIEKQVDKALSERRKELESLAKDLPGAGDPTDTFLQIVDDNKTVMQDLMLHGNYDIFVDQNDMHYPARLVEFFQTFSNQLHGILDEILLPSKTEEILIRTIELRGLALPNFLSPTLMKTLVSEEIDKVSGFCTDIVTETHKYAASFVLGIIEKTTSSFPNLHATYKQIAESVLSTSHTTCMEFVSRILAKERSTVFTVNDYYMQNVRMIQDRLNSIRSNKAANYSHYSTAMSISGFDNPINLSELYNKSNDYQSAFDMKMNLAAYWKVVHKRMADEIPLELWYSLEGALLKSLRNGVLKSKMGHDMSHLMLEHAGSLQKRINLRKRVEVLKECKEVLRTLF